MIIRRISADSEVNLQISIRRGQTDVTLRIIPTFRFLKGRHSGWSGMVPDFIVISLLLVDSWFRYLFFFRHPYCQDY